MVKVGLIYRQGVNIGDMKFFCPFEEVYKNVIDSLSSFPFGCSA